MGKETQSMVVTVEAAQRRRRPKRPAAGTDGKGHGPGSQYHQKTILRALDVLECFSGERPQLSLKEISQSIGLPGSSLFRILLTLESRGYLRQNQDGSYELPPKLLLGKLQERADRMRLRLRPYLEVLARRFNETASSAYFYGPHILVLDTLESFHEIRMLNKAGRVLPPHCSSLGKAIAAFQDPATIDHVVECYGLYPRTANTIVDRRLLLQEFARIREQGYAVDREETVVGGLCIAAPIALESSQVVAALSVSMPLVRVTPGREEEVVQAVREAAQRAARNLPA